MADAPEDDWPEILAEVSSCTYDLRAGRALAFGLPARKHFRIAYTYWAEGEVQTGEYFSEKAVPQGTLFPLRSNPEKNPQKPPQHDHASTPIRVRGSLLAFGAAGSLLLSLMWLLWIRSCQ